MVEKQRRQINIAIIGCGAVTARNHLPAIKHFKDIQVKALIDLNEARAKDLAIDFNVPHVWTDYHAVMNEIDAAIIALPHYLHAPVGIEFLRAGKHILLEKPMALNTAECDALLEAADIGKVVLGIGLVRRYLYAHRFVKQVLVDGLLGKIHSLDVQEGCEYGWPVASDFFFRKDKSGGGVLIDTGAHVMDLISWWFGNCAIDHYEDDACGGVEADCHAVLKFNSGVKGEIILSRLRDLRNTAIIQGTKGSLEVSLMTNQITFRTNNGVCELLGSARKIGTKQPDQTAIDLFIMQIGEWLKATRGQPSEYVSGEEGRQSVALIESCYEKRYMMLRPWQTVGIANLDADT
jgi:predicted dehydrogenase